MKLKIIYVIMVLFMGKVNLCMFMTIRNFRIQTKSFRRFYSHASMGIE